MRHLKLLCVVGALATVLPSQAPVAVFDPTGVLAFDVEGKSWRLRFPELRWPSPAVYALDGAEYGLGVVSPGGVQDVSGRLVVRRFDPRHVDLTITIDDPTFGGELLLNGAIELRRLEPAVVRNQPLEILQVAPLEPADGDLVFCAIGSAGTGLPGQHAIAASIARVAKECKPAFVLLLGDQFAPDGAAKRDDPIFVDRFEGVFPIAAWPMPFHTVIGDAEARGTWSAVLDYSATNARLALPKPSYTFTETVGDVPVQFVALDTPSIRGTAADPLTRRSRAFLAQTMTGENTGWRIAFGHDPLYSHATDVDTAATEQMRTEVGGWLEKLDVDVYLAGGTHVLELLGPKDGVLHVNSGGGGGPEVARSVDWQGDTIFAATGGGSVWFRIRADALEVTVRDADGAALFVHRVEKHR